MTDHTNVEARAIHNASYARNLRQQRLLARGLNFYVEIRGNTVEYVCMCCENPARLDNDSGLLLCGNCTTYLPSEGARSLATQARTALRGLVDEIDKLQGRSWLWRIFFSR